MIDPLPPRSVRWRLPPEGRTGIKPSGIRLVPSSSFWCEIRGAVGTEATLRLCFW
jgi:hypothetical protein